MGRRYLSADYAAVVGRVRAAIPGVAVHGDVIVGFPTEDDGAWRRSLAFIRSIDFAGIHVFRYSARPGTPAIRMSGQVDEATKKRRAAELLAVGSDARARWAAAHVGTVVDVLFEEPLEDGRWVGHAADHTLVATRPADRGPLANVIGRVDVEGVDPVVPARVVGRLVGRVVDPSLRTPSLAGAAR
jgi:threonylcarbamoyladenosine tRNA methylthiotransferase MtaB